MSEGSDRNIRGGTGGCQRAVSDIRQVDQVDVRGQCQRYDRWIRWMSEGNDRDKTGGSGGCQSPLTEI